MLVTLDETHFEARANHEEVDKSDHLPTETHTSGLLNCPSFTWQLKSAVRAHHNPLQTYVTATGVSVSSSLYIISLQILLDGDNVWAHHAPFTGLQLRLLVTLRVTTAKSVTQSKLTNKSMSSGENNLSDNKRQPVQILILLADVSCCLDVI